MASSKRATKDSSVENLLASGGGRCAMDPYHPQDNPKGIVKLGASEDRLCHNIIKERFLKQDMLIFNESTQYYHDFRGTVGLRDALATFITSKFKAAKPIDPDGLFVLNGGDSVIQQFAYAVADEGEGIIVPSPYYSAVYENLQLQFGVKIMNVDVGEDSISIGPSLEELEKVWERASDEGVQVKALFLVNPNNPTGLLMRDTAIRDCILFAHRHNIHVCFDEIYALSTYGNSGPPFTSILSIPDLPDPNTVHFIYGLSKDFALSAYRIGIFYTVNESLKDAMFTSSYYHNIPAVVHKQIEVMLRDEDWVDMYLSNHTATLKKAQTTLALALDQLQLPYMKAQAGFFLFVDFSSVLYEVSVLAQTQLYYHLLNNGVYINPGKVFCGDQLGEKKDGYMRIIFTTYPEYLATGIERLSKVVHNLRVDPDVLKDVDVDAERGKCTVKGFY